MNIINTLKSFINHAYNTCDYYKYLFDQYGINPNRICNIKDLEEIPLLKKETIQENDKLFISNVYETNDLIKSRTSGSTGQLLTIYWTKEDKFRSLFPLWKMRYLKGMVTPSDKCLSFHSFIYNNSNIIETPQIIQDNRLISFSKLKLNEDDMALYYNLLISFAPVWIDSAPNSLYLFLEYVKKNSLKMPKIKHVELSGEYYFDFNRNYIENFLGIKTYNQYGCREANSIAYECENGNLHCFDNIIIEIVDKDSEGYGDVCITVLSNLAMPLIRYKLGDIGKLISTHNCSCGNKNPIIKIKSSRQSDLVKLLNNKIVFSSVFLMVIEKINKLFDNCISQFKVIQNTYIKFDIYLSFIKTKNYDIEMIEEFFLCEINNAGFNNTFWSFIICDNILYDNKTKYKYFISNIE